jgi:hypothetical protein
MLRKGKEKRNGGYCCSNPNCSKVFSRPKIIKYYVCPSCQTLVDMPTQIISDHVNPPKKPNGRVRKQELKAELPLNQLVSNAEIENSKKSVVNEPLDLKLEFVEECEPVDTTSLEDKVQLAVEGKVSTELDFQCSHYFGFLSERIEGQEIPETCFGCLKSIECMLSKSNKSEESVQEIKQWYLAKA